MGSIRQAIVIISERVEPIHERTGSDIPSRPESGAGLAEAFLKDTYTAARKAACAEVLLAYTPDEARDWFAGTFPQSAFLPQGKGDLGERMETVFQAAWRLRYQPCLLLGTRTPDLPPSVLAAAFASLQPGPEQAEITLGPASDGSFYLLGAKWLPPGFLAGLAWNSGSVLRQILERVGREEMRAHLLEPWYSVSSAEELIGLSRRLETAAPEVGLQTRAALARRGETSPLP